MTAGADVQAARFVGLVMDVGEVRHGLIAADGAADALEDPVCAAARAQSCLTCPLSGVSVTLATAASEPQTGQ